LASIGPRSLIVPPATILCPHRIEIGDRVLVLENCHFSVVEEHGGERYSPRLRIGDGTVVGPRCWLSCVGDLEIGSEVLIGPGVLVADAFHEYRQRGPILHQPMRRPSPVRIEAGAFVGPGAAVLSGVRVGAGAYVMPGSVVISDVPPRAVVAGNPAEVIRSPADSGEGWIDTPAAKWAPLLDALRDGAGDAA
jgi:acetyltransferase-like isoleucine patch superfamily enzyme